MTDKVRDHLANERTFLSWARTALGVIGLGFVMARMGIYLKELGGPGPAGGASGSEFLYIGVVFLALGTALGGWAGWHYRTNRRAIEAEEFGAAAASVSVLAAAIVVAGLVIVGLVVRRWN